MLLVEDMYLKQTEHVTKKHGIKDGLFENNGEGNEVKYSVNCFLKYVNLLHPDSKDLWQRPRVKSTCVTKSPLGW